MNRRGHRRVGVLAAAFAGVGLFSTVAGIAALVGREPLHASVLAALAFLAVGFGVHEHRTTRRLERIADEVLLLRLATESVAQDGARTARSTERLAGSTERGVRASLVARLLSADASTDASPDPALLAALLAVSPRHALFVGEEHDAARLAAALTRLSPASRLHHVPSTAEEAGSALDRLATRAHMEGLPTPLVLALGHAHVHEAVWGTTGGLIRERYRVRELVVVVPPGAQTVVDEGPRHPTVRATRLGTTLVLVSAVTE